MAADDFIVTLSNQEACMSHAVQVSKEDLMSLSLLVPKQRQDVHSTMLDWESVVLNLSTGRYYTLNPVGALTWNQCQGDRSLAEILESVCREFDVPADQAHRDLMELMRHLEEEGLLHIERR